VEGVAAGSVPPRRRGVAALSFTVLLAAGCGSTPKLKSWEIYERVESQIRIGMLKRQVLGILGEPTQRRWRVYGGAEREPISEVTLYSECWYWGRDATVCFGPDRPYEVTYKHATSDSTSHRAAILTPLPSNPSFQRTRSARR
jgi:hypothetical protein